MTGTAFAGIAEEYHRYRVPYRLRSASRAWSMS